MTHHLVSLPPTLPPQLFLQPSRSEQKHPTPYNYCPTLPSIGRDFSSLQEVPSTSRKVTGTSWPGYGNMVRPTSPLQWMLTTNSTFIPEEAIILYSQYLHPRLAYPLLCTLLSQANCRHIQAPALAALLPKLHINRHAPRVVVFSGITFGGLGLKDYFIDQGYQQLRYLVGHIKLNDDVGPQFLI